MTTTTTTHEVISRAEAKAKGLRRYFTGKPCKRGHVCDRITASKNCSMCESERKSAWDDLNREKKNRISAQYYASNRDAMKEKHLAYRTANKEARAQYVASWRENNKDKARAISARYCENNKSAIRERTHKRRAKKLAATPDWDVELTSFVMQEAADIAIKREISTGIAWDVDHMIPLQAKQACGLHVATNLQVIPASMNRSKNNKMMLTEPGEWISHL